jgi:hypothetical protein
MMRTLIVAVALLIASITRPSAGAVLAPGDYLEDDFVETLLATRSPLAALSEVGHGPQSIRIVPDGDSLKFVANENWHEGYVIFILHADGSMTRGEEGIDYPKPQIESPLHFRFIRPGPISFWHGYTRVGDADAAVARLTLVGKYFDLKQNPYEFGADGVLRGMGPDTLYSLDNDHVSGNPFDFIYLGVNKKTALAFKWQGLRLFLYSLLPSPPGDPSIGEPDFKHPLLILDRVRADPQGVLK